MGRKVLQDIANTLCQMFVGWRLGDDYEKLGSLPDGILDIDLIQGQALHSSGSIPELWITGELGAWFKHRLDVHGIPSSAVLCARLTVHHVTDRILTDRKKLISFDFSCDSVIETSDARYTGTLVERHTYHQRLST